jgi:hypothetical protein
VCWSYQKAYTRIDFDGAARLGAVGLDVNRGHEFSAAGAESNGIIAAGRSYPKTDDPSVSAGYQRQNLRGRRSERIRVLLRTCSEQNEQRASKVIRFQRWYGSPSYQRPLTSLAPAE